MLEAASKGVGFAHFSKVSLEKLSSIPTHVVDISHILLFYLRQKCYRLLLFALVRLHYGYVLAHQLNQTFQSNIFVPAKFDYAIPYVQEIIDVLEKHAKFSVEKKKRQIAFKKVDPGTAQVRIARSLKGLTKHVSSLQKKVTDITELQTLLTKSRKRDREDTTSEDEWFLALPSKDKKRFKKVFTEFDSAK
jgi:hypothetical protein